MNTLVTLITAGITFGTVLLYGTLGEILTEKSGSLNLGVEGIMYMGGAFGLAGAFYYEKAAGGIGNGPVAIVIAILAAFAAGALASAIYSFLTITPSQLSRAINAIYDSFCIGRDSVTISSSPSFLTGRAAGPSAGTG